MKENRKKSIYYFLTMNKSEIESLDSHFFMNYLTHLCPSLLSMVSKEIWDSLSYEQLGCIRQNVFNYLNDDILNMLYSKFKNNSNSLQIKKPIKDKSILIIAEPLFIKLQKAIEYRKTKKDKMKRKYESLRILREYNQSESKLIPIDLIEQVIPIDKHFSYEKTDNIYIRKRDFLNYLETICNQDIHLTEIPNIATVQDVCFKYQMEAFNRQYLQSLTAKKTLAFRVDKITYFKYEDIIEHIINS